ncbi:MAG TPA: YifB family Mg chelatase-like AAA ATPase [Candidatus Paceibacterota bacterium]|nr:YifB family Mg chelatase-like AAA ATPase [Candidatus Paceibacterota bacterium]
MFSSVSGAQTIGINAKIVRAETDISRGLNAFSIVGLADKAVEESRDRVNSSIKNSGWTGPKQSNQKTVIALAPADLKKEGPIFDLPIALSYLLATKQIRAEVKGRLFLGELSLNGELRPVKGVLPIAEQAKAAGFQEIFLPKENAKEAALIDNICIYGAQTLKEVVEHINQGVRDEEGNEIPPKEISLQPKTAVEYRKPFSENDFGSIKGQEGAKRALVIAAAGGHNIAMYGPPGTGKTMLARCFAGILPNLSFEEILEVTGLHSVSGSMKESLVTTVPFRSPHHTASFVSLIGGGTIPRPGEITLAHRGVLFLDEFPEFERRSIEALRQPLEDRIVNITRAQGTVQYPANFILIAAMNPCPCGNYGSEKGKRCICTPSELIRYQRKLSGPIMDRIDIWVQVGKVDPAQLGGEESLGESEVFRKAVKQAREIQKKRFKGTKKYLNKEMSNTDIAGRGNLSNEAEKILQTSAKTMDISARSYYRIIKTARTIADLENSESIEPAHILEALQYRPRNFEGF